MIMNAQRLNEVIKRETGLDFFAEDRSYALKPLKWYLHKPWWGLRRLHYIKETFDCDDFTDRLKVDLVKRFASKQTIGGHGMGSGYALPVFRCKIELPSGGFHWVLGVITAEDEGVRYIERTPANIVEFNKKKIKKFWRVYP